MMKRILCILTILGASLLAGHAQAQETQQVALIDMQYLLSKIPAAVDANKQMQKSTEQWQNEIKSYQDKAQQLYVQYQKELSSMDANTRVERENAIVQVENQARDLQKKYFGPDGEMATLQKKLIKPVQDKIYEAVKLISKRRGYIIVFDRASAPNIIFADPVADISNDVLAVLGYSD